MRLRCVLMGHRLRQTKGIPAWPYVGGYTAEYTCERCGKVTTEQRNVVPW